MVLERHLAVSAVSYEALSVLKDDLHALQEGPNLIHEHQIVL